MSRTADPNKGVRYGTTLPKHIDQAVRGRAQLQGRSISSIIARLVSKGLEVERLAATHMRPDDWGLEPQDLSPAETLLVGDE